MTTTKSVTVSDMTKDGGLTSIVTTLDISNDALEERQAISPTALKRKRNKPLIEKRRRARINDCLHQLQSIIMKDKTSQRFKPNRLEKADILEMTVDYIKTMAERKQNQTQENQNNPPEATGEFKDDKREAYESGFLHCIEEVGSFLTSNDKTFDSSTACKILVHCRALLNSTLENGSLVEFCSRDPSSECDKSASATKKKKCNEELPDSTNAPTSTRNNLTPEIENENHIKYSNTPNIVLPSTIDATPSLMEEASISSSTPKNLVSKEISQHNANQTDDNVYQPLPYLLLQKNENVTSHSNHVSTASPLPRAISVLSSGDILPSSLLLTSKNSQSSEHHSITTNSSSEIMNFDTLGTSITPSIPFTPPIMSHVAQWPFGSLTQTPNFPQPSIQVPLSLSVPASSIQCPTKVLNNAAQQGPYVIPVKGQVWIVIENDNLAQTIPVTSEHSPNAAKTGQNNYTQMWENKDCNDTYRAPTSNKSTNNSGLDSFDGSVNSFLDFKSMANNYVRGNDTKICKNLNDYTDGVSLLKMTQGRQKHSTVNTCSGDSCNSLTKSRSAVNDCNCRSYFQELVTKTPLTKERKENQDNDAVPFSNKSNTIQNAFHYDPLQCPHGLGYHLYAGQRKTIADKTCELMDCSKKNNDRQSSQQSNLDDLDVKETKTLLRNEEQYLLLETPSSTGSELSYSADSSSEVLRNQNLKTTIRYSNFQTLPEIPRKDSPHFVYKDVSTNYSALDLSNHSRLSGDTPDLSSMSKDENKFNEEYNNTNIICQPTIQTPVKCNHNNYISSTNVHPHIKNSATFNQSLPETHSLNKTSSTLSNFDENNANHTEGFHLSLERHPNNTIRSQPIAFSSPQSDHISGGGFIIDSAGNQMVANRKRADDGTVFCHSNVQQPIKTHLSMTPQISSVTTDGCMWRPW